MLSHYGQVSNEKVIATSYNLKNIKRASDSVIEEMNIKSHFVDEMSNDEYTNYIYLRLLAMEAKKRTTSLEKKKYLNYKSHF